MDYNRQKAVAYAHETAFNYNDYYYDFTLIGGDCTNFASQVLYAGSGVMNWTPILGWYYVSANNRTPSWTGVNELYNFLVNNNGSGPQGKEVGIYDIKDGDLVQLSFNGRTFSHTPVIVDKGNNTLDTILVAAHTFDSDNRPLSTYNFLKIRFIHIVNVGI